MKAPDRIFLTVVDKYRRWYSNRFSDTDIEYRRVDEENQDDIIDSIIEDVNKQIMSHGCSVNESALSYALKSKYTIIRNK